MVRSVIDTGTAEAIDIQAVIAPVTIGHAKLDGGRLAGDNLEDLKQPCSQARLGLEASEGHPVLGGAVATLAINPVVGKGASFQQLYAGAVPEWGSVQCGEAPRGLLIDVSQFTQS